MLIKNYNEIETYVLDNAIDAITRYENMKLDYKKYMRDFSLSEKEAIEKFGLFVH